MEKNLPRTPQATKGKKPGAHAAGVLLKGALLDVSPEAFNNVALLHVLVILERHAAFLTSHHLFHFVLEALQSRELAFVDDHIVAHEANTSTAFNLAIGDTATRNFTDL
jgi:hypothetical protein